MKRRGRQQGATQEELAAARAKGQYSGKTGGRPKKLRIVKGWEPAAILDLAEHGVEAGDIEKAMELDLTSPERRTEFERLVELGHARWRIELADIQYKATKGRKTTALKESTAAWLPRYAEDVASTWSTEIAGAKDRFRAMNAKLREHQKKLKESGDAA